MGTDTGNYKFDEEIARLEYFAEILRALSYELSLDKENGEQKWNTYNAVYMLLECKEKYRFFSLFGNEDVKEKTALSEVVTRERFCFFEDAYKKSKSSDDPWDLSYFLESQLYIDKCDIKKGKHLPSRKELEQHDSCWSYMERGKDDDELSTCLKKMINKIKERL